MNNHLSHRWPEAPVTPLLPPQAPKQKKNRRRLKTFFLLLACMVAIAALVAGAYFGIIYAAERFAAGAIPTPAPSDAPSGPLPSPPEDLWTPGDLDWTTPDPEVQISLSPAAEAALTPQEIYQTLLPSVVYIEVKQKGAEAYSMGSGIVLTETGYIVTNYHVIQGGESITVMPLPDGLIYEARLVGYDEEFDLAVLKADARGLTPAPFSDSDRLKVGDTIYAIGNPMGHLLGSMTEGIISSLARQVDFDERTMTLIQISASLNSGNSGGALIDTYGQVAGITVAKYTGMQGDTVLEGLGLAIPITDMLPFINHIIHTGTSCRPSLGIMCYEAQQGGRRGILVDEATPDTPAEELLRKGDFIVAANGTPINRLYDLSRILYATGVGGQVELTVIRHQNEITMTITLYDRLTH